MICINLSCLNPVTANARSNYITFRFGTACKHNLRENVGQTSHFVCYDGSYTTGTNDQNFSHLMFLINKFKQSNYLQNNHIFRSYCRFLFCKEKYSINLHFQVCNKVLKCRRLKDELAQKSFVFATRSLRFHKGLIKNVINCIVMDNIGSLFEAYRETTWLLD